MSLVTFHPPRRAEHPAWTPGTETTDLASTDGRNELPARNQGRRGLCSAGISESCNDLRVAGLLLLMISYA